VANGRRKGAVIAQAAVDSRGFVSGDTPNLYVGLQENTVVPPVYGGLEVTNRTMCPRLKDVGAISFSMRATRCYGDADATADAAADASQRSRAVGYGRVAFYIDYWSRTHGRGRALSVDVFTFLDGTPWRPTLPIRRPTPFMDDGHALHLDGAQLGYVPPGTEPTLDSSPNCTLTMEVRMYRPSQR
jgi:hypothetical protein